MNVGVSLIPFYFSLVACCIDMLPIALEILPTDRAVIISLWIELYLLSYFHPYLFDRLAETIFDFLKKFFLLNLKVFFMSRKVSGLN